MKAGDIITHAEMCHAEGQMLQRGMTFRAPPNHGIILMSQRPNAPYADVLDDDGNLIYEGHDQPRSPTTGDPKALDQPRFTARGSLTENGKFAESADRHKESAYPPARFRVYEKIRDGIWTFRGMFLLTDYRYEQAAPGDRYVFRFVLRAIEDSDESLSTSAPPTHELQTRQIPTWVKQFVYKRDSGRCVTCGSSSQLHYDHDLPFSKGGSSATPDNVRLLCAHHNLAKSDKIE
jgi:hypothetical protein